MTKDRGQSHFWNNQVVDTPGRSRSLREDDSINGRVSPGLSQGTLSDFRLLLLQREVPRPPTDRGPLPPARHPSGIAGVAEDVLPLGSPSRTNGDESSQNGPTRGPRSRVTRVGE